MNTAALFSAVIISLLVGNAVGACLQARVLGAGVVGITSAVQLQKLGYNVTIHAYASPLQNSEYAFYASPHAGAWWSGNWNEYSYQSYSALMGLTVTEPLSTAATRKALVYYITPPTSASELAHQYYADNFVNFTSEHLASTYGGKFSYGYEMTAVIVTAPEYTKFMLDKFLAAGGKLIHENITRLSDLANKENTDLVVNAPGLGARFLGDVEDAAVYPQRGQTLIMRSAGAETIYRARGPVDASDPGNWGTYILPRINGEIVVGGTRQDNDWNTTVSDVDRTNILNRAKFMMPALETATVVKDNVGFRPGRTGGIRVELDTTSFKVPVLHHYGHGGAGFEESWGSTVKAIGLVQARFTSGSQCTVESSASEACEHDHDHTSAAGRVEPFFKFW